MHNRDDPNAAMILEPDVLKGIIDTALFYPCCGQDLEIPICLFARAVSDFYFIDTRRPRRPELRDIAQFKSRVRCSAGADQFVHLASGHEFRLHRWGRRGEEILQELPKLGVFFFRGDNPVHGEGSSGVLWLGSELFSQILALLIPGGLVVTDGSNRGPNGPGHLSKFYHNREIGPAAKALADPFDYGGRSFTCVGYAGEKYGPTLIWQVV